MRRLMMVLLLLGVVVHTQAAQLDPINIEIDPVIQSKTVAYPPPLVGGYREFYVDIQLPQVTLSPADVLNINVHFTDNKMLQVINDPCGVSFELVFSNSDWFNTPCISNGGWELSFLHYYDWPYPHTTGMPYVDGAPNPHYMWSSRPETIGQPWNPFFDNVENGACFGDFTLTLHSPSSILLPGFDPIATTTFTKNSIKLYARDSGSWVDPDTLRVVPEPASLLLLGLGGLILRKREP